MPAKPAPASTETPRIVALAAIYNEADTIERMLDSIHGHVDRVVLLDGAWDHFPDASPESTDGTQDRVKRWQDKNRPSCLEWIAPSTPWPSQVAKRTRLIEQLQPGEWGLVIDGDETLHSAPRALHNAIAGATVPCFRIKLHAHTGKGLAIRLVRAATGLHYHGNHHTLHNAQHENLKDLVPRKPIPGIHLTNAPYHRNTTRDANRRRYYQARQNHTLEK